MIRQTNFFCIYLFYRLYQQHDKIHQEPYARLSLYLSGYPHRFLTIIRAAR